MNQEKENLNRMTLLVVLLVVVAGVTIVFRASGQEATNGRPTVVTEQWEYLAVAGPNTTSLTAIENPRLRKEPNVSFGREAYALEQHLDKLGANGWELVAIGGPPTDPAYYFKRRK